MNVALLLSGGVDSSVALHRLLAEGHRVTAFYLKIWLEDELAHLGECPWEDDLRHARQVCTDAGIPLEVVPLQREYHERVVRSAVDALRAGATPSPDIWCNQRVKFGAFLDALGDLDFDFDKIATGHYARITEKQNRFRLLRGVDPVKDQTYFLYRLDQDQLSRCLFPLGGLHKDEVRRLARELALPNRDRKDSQGICFLGKIPFDAFVRSYLGDDPGPIREIESGRNLGEHRGLWFHTIGQRKGLGLGGGPWYVVAKEMNENTLWISHRDTLPRHGRCVFLLPDVHWIGDPPDSEGILVRVRHSPTLVAARWRPHDGGGIEVRMSEADPGLASGQSAVLYQGEACLGGGFMTLPTPSPVFGVAETVGQADRSTDSSI